MCRFSCVWSGISGNHRLRIAFEGLILVARCLFLRALLSYCLVVLPSFALCLCVFAVIL